AAAVARPLVRPPGGRRRRRPAMSYPAFAPPWPAPAAPAGGLPAGELSADVAIVGAGLLGLSTAVHLVQRDPGLDVLVLDAGNVAAGASGRGTGLLGPRVGPAVDRARARYGDEVTRRMYL